MLLMMKSKSKRIKNNKEAGTSLTVVLMTIMKKMRIILVIIVLVKVRATLVMYYRNLTTLS